MPIPAIRIIKPTTIRNFGRFGDAVEVPPLTDVQTESYKATGKGDAHQLALTDFCQALLGLNEFIYID